CQQRTCDMGTCGFDFTTQGTPTTTQTKGDCKINVCDGMGGVSATLDANDVPNDNNDCTQDLCNNGVPINKALTSGTICASKGGHVCDGAGNCVPCLVSTDCNPGQICNNQQCLGTLLALGASKDQVISGEFH